jgi:hypothetical protein
MTTEACVVFATRVKGLRVKLQAEQQLLNHARTSVLQPFRDSLLAEIARTMNELEDLTSMDGEVEGHVPQRLFADLERRSLGLFGECLALRLAEYTRNSVGDALCRMADQLLSELIAKVAFGKPQFTTVADAEYIGNSSRIIRLRYPATSIWDLPVVGHEFGHSFGPHWHVPDGLDPYPRERFLNTASLGSRLVNDEYFCDAFATFILGPSYPAMCLLDRFDPTNTSDGDTHPSDVKRAWWVLRALELVGEHAPTPDDRNDLIETAARLRKIWLGFSEACNVFPLSDAESVLLEVSLQKLIGQLWRSLPGAAYISQKYTWGLIADFKEQIYASSSHFSLGDLLNASWLLRFENLSDAEKVHVIGEWAWSESRRFS